MLNRSVQSKWNLRKAALPLAEDPAQRSFRELLGLILPATVEPDQEPVPVAQRTVSFTEIKLPTFSQNTTSIYNLNPVIRKENCILEITNSALDKLLLGIGEIPATE